MHHNQKDKVQFECIHNTTGVYCALVLPLGPHAVFMVFLGPWAWDHHLDALWVLVSRLDHAFHIAEERLAAHTLTNDFVALCRSRHCEQSVKRWVVQNNALRPHDLNASKETQDIEDVL